MSGCAPTLTMILPERENKDWPELNQKTTVSVGDRMLIQGYSETTMALLIKSDLSGFCYKTPSGTYRVRGEDETNLYFNALGTNGMNRPEFFGGSFV